jgi:hypothetical protein
MRKIKRKGKRCSFPHSLLPEPAARPLWLPTQAQNRSGARRLAAGSGGNGHGAARGGSARPAQRRARAARDAQAGGSRGQGRLSRERRLAEVGDRRLA